MLSWVFCFPEREETEHISFLSSWAWVRWVLDRDVVPAAVKVCPDAFGKRTQRLNSW